MRLWAARAGVAERAVWSRHLRAVCRLPGTRLGLAHWPSSFTDQVHAPFNYWWQAHLLDCLVDAQQRGPGLDRPVVVRQLLRGIRLRGLGRWVNRYYDDMAWLGLALQRTSQVFGIERTAAVETLGEQLVEAWTPDGGGGIWWRRDDDYKNTPANGPAAIFFARRGDPDSIRRSVFTMDWIADALLDAETGLVYDGVRVSRGGEIRERDRRIFSYCQGVVLGACVELLAVTGDLRWRDWAERTIDAVAEHLADSEGVLRGHGGGDGGLFTGILVRYLADAARRLPPAAESARRTSAELVTAAAEAVWRNRAAVACGPLFGPDWSVPAPIPAADGSGPERDLSVQLSGWMVLEAAAALECGAGPL